MRNKWALATATIFERATTDVSVGDNASTTSCLALVGTPSVEEQLRRIRKHLTSKTATSYAEQLVKRIADHQHPPDERAVLLEGLALGADRTLNAQLFDAVVSSLSDDDVDLRFTALSCIPRLSAANRVKLQSRLECLAQQDADASVRRAARHLLTGA